MPLQAKHHVLYVAHAVTCLLPHNHLALPYIMTGFTTKILVQFIKSYLPLYHEPISTHTDGSCSEME